MPMCSRCLVIAWTLLAGCFADVAVGAATVPLGTLIADPSGAVLAERFELPAELITALGGLPLGGSLAVEAFPSTPGQRRSVVVERYSTYAPDARILVLTGSAPPREVPRSSYLQFRVRAPNDPSWRAGLTLDPADRSLRGLVLAGADYHELVPPAPGETTHRLVDVARQTAVEPTFVGCGSDQLPIPSEVMALAANAKLNSFIHAPEGTPTYVAAIAVDTDNEWNHKKFANNTVSATNWLVSLFTEMNVMYERDVVVTLLQGTTFLRLDLDVSPTYNDDPWTVATSGVGITHLNEFGNFWSANMGAVPRVMAMLLSGKSSNPNSSSGIAWVDGYCETQNTGGGYSVTQTFTSNTSVLNDVRVIAHELGHNFGSPHTHCYSPPIDMCFGSEPGCYSGPLSCPGGPGTMMSYCHFSGSSCGSNQIVFHSRTIALIDGLIADHAPSCIVPLAQPIFGDGFEVGSTAAWDDTNP